MDERISWLSDARGGIPSKQRFYLRWSQSGYSSWWWRKPEWCTILPSRRDMWSWKFAMCPLHQWSWAYMCCLLQIAEENKTAKYVIYICFIIVFIHPIHRFKSSDWLKEGHTTWIIFDNVHIWKLIHVYYFYYFPDSRRSCHSCGIWNSIAYFPDFTVRYGLQIYEWGE